MFAAGGLLTPGKVIGPNELWDRFTGETTPRDGRGRTEAFRTQLRGVSRAGEAVPRGVAVDWLSFARRGKRDGRPPVGPTALPPDRCAHRSGLSTGKHELRTSRCTP